MNSRLEKEGLVEKVQMIYIDPPYGIKYGSNFPPFVNKQDVEDRKDEDLTQEPETIKAFRDTWELGIHSYLTYLRNRLLLSREPFSIPMIGLKFVSSFSWRKTSSYSLCPKSIFHQSLYARGFQTHWVIYDTRCSMSP